MSKQEVLQRIIAAQVDGKKTIWLGGQGITELPEVICELPDLEELLLANNMLTTLPECISNLASLRMLNLGWNKLETLPQSLSNLTNLTDLYLEGNQDLRQLPSPLRVKFLNIADCPRIEMLPDDIVASKIDIANTGLTSLPTSLKDAEIYWEGLKIEYRIAFQRHTITVMDVLRYHDESHDYVLNLMGYERFLQEAQAEILDAQQLDTVDRQLIHIQLPGKSRWPYLSQRDLPTGLWRLIRVSEIPQTCEQAYTELVEKAREFRLWYRPD